MSTKRILFADDEPNALAALRRTLRARLGEWDCEFVESGEAAVDALKHAPFDIVVSDMRMRGMDGTALLTRAKELCPGALRIILSGTVEADLALRAVPVAHQFVAKPCDPKIFQEIIGRALGVRDLIADARLRELLGGTASLPAVPRVYARIRERLADARWTIADLALDIEKDPALVAKILRVANSGFFSLPRPMVGLAETIGFLGASTIQQLVLSFELDGAFGASQSVPAAVLEQHRAHALLVANLARRLQTDRHLAESSFTAGLLHDIGQLALAVAIPGTHERVGVEAQMRGVPVQVAEQELFGVTHAEVGAFLLGTWGLPYPIVEAVAFHHRANAAGPSTFDALAATCVSECLVEELASPAKSTGAVLPCEPLLRSLELTDRIEGWRELAASLRES